MDYEKETYFKISELERLISGNRNFGVSGIPFRSDCPAGIRTTVAEYTGGSALFTVTVTSEGSGGIDVYFGGMRVGSVASGGTATAVFTAAGGGNVELRPALGVTVGDVYVSAFGVGCDFHSDIVPIAADGGEGGAYAAYSAEGSLRAFRLDGSDFVPVFEISGATAFDIACRSGETVVAYISEGKARLSALDGRGALIGDGRDIAITATDGGWVAAVYDGTEVYAVRLDGDLVPLERVTVKASGSVAGMRFIKHSDVLRLIISDGVRNVMSVAGDEAYADLSLRFRVEMYY